MIRQSGTWASLAMAVGLLVLSSGCALDVEMTSTPDSVHLGDPVTFNVKATNRSECPVGGAIVEIFAFISASDFRLMLFGDLPPDLPPEILDFLDQLSAFFDDLCTGGTPDVPTAPMSPDTSCHRGENEIVCEMSGAVAAHDGTGSMTFGGLGNRLQCAVDGGSISCQLHFPLGNPAAAARGGAAVSSTDTFTCVDATDLGIVQLGSSLALCYLGAFPNFTGLDPNGMATGQISLPARGSGFVRNLAFATTGAGSDDDLGVCKGGTDAGKACDQTDLSACPGSACGEGICDSGANEGKGCDVATQAADCPMSTCQLCSDLAPGYLPIDCTTTYVTPQAAPAMSPWALIGLAAFLVMLGTVFLQRRARRA